MEMAENGECKNAGCEKTAPKVSKSSQEDDRYCGNTQKKKRRLSRFFSKTSARRFYLASTHTCFVWDQSCFFVSVRYCNLRMPTCINNAPWQRSTLLQGCFGLSLGESEVEAQVILKSRVEVPPSQLPFLVSTKLEKNSAIFPLEIGLG